MNKYQVTGGVMIGKSKVTWPFGSIRADYEKLVINAELSGYYIFHPDEVMSLQDDVSGLRIIHTVEEYDKNIVFLTAKNSRKMISKIRETGFLDGKERNIESKSKVVSIREQKKGFPIRKEFKVLFSILWSGLFILDFVLYYLDGMEGIPIGNGATIAIISTILIPLLLIFSKDFKKRVFKDGWEVNDFLKSLVFLMFVGLFLLIILLIFSNVGF